MSDLNGITAAGLDGASPIGPATHEGRDAPGGAGPAGPSVALISVSAAGTITMADAFFSSLATAAPGGVVGSHLRLAFPSLDLPEPGRGGHARLVAQGPADDRAHDVAWTWAGESGWIGAIVLPAPTANPEGAAVHRDALTGLGDRASLRPIFDDLVVRRDGVDPSVVLACIDLDRFKAVNDSLGHAAGDDLLRKVAKRLLASIRASDVVIRMGGDEFLVLLTECSAETAEAMAQRMIDVIQRPFVVLGHQVIIGASIGLARLEPGTPDVDVLLRQADVALYRSKHAGRGCFHWFVDGMFAALEERRLLETDLRKALLLDQFFLTYQSQFEFGSASITGFEALIRWRHPTRGLLSPAVFIPIAEETGMILKIGAWVMAEACRTAMSWPLPLVVAVNVSPAQFEADGFLESVHAALASSGLPPHRLELELTESVLLTEDDIVLARMQALRAIGVRLSLDDFGTGYSSLNYLRKYPFTKVKIDQSFVREPLADENAHRIVAAVAGLGAAMGMAVIAEGVETEEQLARIRLQGCSAAQGYLLSRPISPEGIAAYLDEAAREARDRTNAIQNEKPRGCR